MYSLKVTDKEIIIKIYKEKRISLQNIKNYRLERFFKTGHCKYQIIYSDINKDNLVVEITLIHINEFVDLMNRHNIQEIKA